MPKLRYLTAGESHGPILTGILEGMSAGFELIASRDIDPYLKDRQKGYGRGRRQQIEEDRATISSGVRFGKTLGSPISLTVPNKDWQNWEERMSILPLEQQDSKPVTIPRPGHSDYAGGIKYGHEDDLRNVFERASARETAMRTAIGAIGLRLLDVLGIQHLGFVTAIGSVELDKDVHLGLAELQAQTSKSEVRTPSVEFSKAMMAEIDRTKAEGDTLGGVVECRFEGVPVGIGSHVHWDRKLDALLTQAAMSVQAVKAVEIGEGIRMSRSRGSEVHDSFELNRDQLGRHSNNAGGIEGGMSNGETIVLRAYMKPISTLMTPLNSVDLSTGEATKAHIERSDVCAVPALSVILEAVVGLALASAILDTFGGDAMEELVARVDARRTRTSLIPKINSKIA